MAYLITFLLNTIYVYKLFVLVRCVFSWISLDPYSNPLFRFIYEITDPPMDAIRRALPFLEAGGIDFSPIILFMALHYIENMLRGVLI